MTLDVMVKALYIVALVAAAYAARPRPPAPRRKPRWSWPSGPPAGGVGEGSAVLDRVVKRPVRW